MYAIVNMAGFQEKVSVGDTLTIPLQNAEEGKTVTFKDVLMIDKDGDVSFGKPFVDGASVEVKVLAHGRDKKIRVFKFKQRKRYMKSQGHRQQNTKVEVVKINA